MLNMATARKRAIIIVILVAVFAALYARYSHAGLYRVIEVYDGDTIAVDMNGSKEIIRLIGIDTPETKDPRKLVQCYGPEASEYTHRILNNVKVRLVADPLSTNRDRYDRLLRYLYLQNGSFYNKKLLLAGYARAYTGFPFSKSNDFTIAEQAAKDSNTGLWSSCAN